MQYSPHTNNPIEVNGANLLVWALAGADLLGSPGFRNLNNNDPFDGAPRFRGLAPWADDMGNQPGVGLYALDGTRPAQPRIGPFVDVSKTKFANRVSAGEFEIPVADKPRIPSPCVLDAWGQPILYYRANPSKSDLVSEGNNNSTTGIYGLADNILFTGSNGQGMNGMDLGAGPTTTTPHRIAALGQWDPMTTTVPRPYPTPVGSLAYHLYNPNIQAAYRPHNADSYILLSAGKDALYGTADDVANFEINK